MSDCSANAWRVPEQREPGVLYMHGYPGTDYAAIDAIEVDGQRFERVRECEVESDWCYIDGVLPYTSEDTWAYKCKSCEQVFRYERGTKPNYCPNCGAKVVSEDE